MLYGDKDLIKNVTSSNKSKKSTTCVYKDNAQNQKLRRVGDTCKKRGPKKGSRRTGLSLRKADDYNVASKVAFQKNKECAL